MDMKNQRLEHLDALFNPQTIAFIGATEETNKWGFIVFNSILRGGWKGRIFPVNPGRETVLGIKAFNSVKDIPEAVDLAVMTVPAKYVPMVIDDCLSMKIKAGLIISAGFREMGGDRRRIEAEMVARARAGGMVLVGPNCQGIFCPASRLYAHMPRHFFIPPGKVAVVSQSGNISNMIVGAVYEAGQGVAMGVSSGNEADLRLEDYLTYMAEKPEVASIVAYIENMPEGRRFFEQAARVTRRKPVVVLKGGRTPSGKKAASSHTGAMAVEEALFADICRQSGIIRARTIEEAGILGASFVNRPLPRGNRMAIMTGGGGLGVLAADICSDEGFNVVSLSDETIGRLKNFLPDWWVPGNPVDLVAGNRFDTILPIMKILLKSNEIDALIFTFVGPPKIDRADIAKNERHGIKPPDLFESLGAFIPAFIDQVQSLSFETGVPVYPVFSLPEMIRTPFVEMPIEKPGAIYKDVEPACRALAAMHEYRRFRQKQENRDR
jgi:acyl-CoA synthetase (NDP forming)